MDVAPLIREIRALPEGDQRTILETLQVYLDDEPFEIPDYHRQLISERIRRRDADLARGEPVEFIQVMAASDAAEVNRLLDLDDAGELKGDPLDIVKNRWQYRAR